MNEAKVAREDKEGQVERTLDRLPMGVASAMSSHRPAEQRLLRAGGSAQIRT